MVSGVERIRLVTKAEAEKYGQRLPSRSPSRSSNTSGGRSYGASQNARVKSTKRRGRASRQAVDDKNIDDSHDSPGDNIISLSSLSSSSDLAGLADLAEYYSFDPDDIRPECDRRTPEVREKLAKIWPEQQALYEAEEEIQVKSNWELGHYDTERDYEHLSESVRAMRHNVTDLSGHFVPPQRLPTHSELSSPPDQSFQLLEELSHILLGTQYGAKSFPKMVAGYLEAGDVYHLMLANKKMKSALSWEDTEFMNPFGENRDGDQRRAMINAKKRMVLPNIKLGKIETPMLTNVAVLSVLNIKHEKPIEAIKPTQFWPYIKFCYNLHSMEYSGMQTGARWKPKKWDGEQQAIQLMLRSIFNKPWLLRVDLSGNPLQDKMMNSVEGLIKSSPSLQELGVQNCSLSVAAIDQLADCCQDRDFRIKIGDNWPEDGCGKDKPLNPERCEEHMACLLTFIKYHHDPTLIDYDSRNWRLHKHSPRWQSILDWDDKLANMVWRAFEKYLLVRPIKPAFEAVGVMKNLPGRCVQLCVQNLMDPMNDINMVLVVLRAWNTTRAEDLFLSNKSAFDFLFKALKILVLQLQREDAAHLVLDIWRQYFYSWPFENEHVVYVTQIPPAFPGCREIQHKVLLLMPSIFKTVRQHVPTRLHTIRLLLPMIQACRTDVYYEKLFQSFSIFMDMDPVERIDMRLVDKDDLEMDHLPCMTNGLPIVWLPDNLVRFFGQKFYFLFSVFVILSDVIIGINHRRRQSISKCHSSILWPQWYDAWPTSYLAISWARHKLFPGESGARFDVRLGDTSEDFGEGMRSPVGGLFYLCRALKIAIC